MQQVLKQKWEELWDIDRHVVQTTIAKSSQCQHARFSNQNILVLEILLDVL